MQSLGKSVGGFSTKIHATVDALGNPLRLLLTGGQKGDATQAIPLLEGFDFTGVMADRGYDADDILDFIAQNGAEAVIPAKKNRIIQRETDWHTYKGRHLVECFMNKIKQYRRIFSRFEKYARRYMSFLSFASALIWLR
jgi:transposase